jgi:MtN3 and saliva related transmembrane protein
MDSQRVLEVAVSIWGVAMAVSPGLQIRQMLRTGESEDVSIPYFAVLIVGFALWALYGLSIDSIILATCNSIALVFGTATILVATRLRRRARAHT